MTDDILMIVPARGGSVGVLRKNTRVIDGKPLVLHKLDQVAAAGIGRVVCSTNDRVIASIARVAGYEVHWRTDTGGPAATIADTVTEVVHDLGWKGPVGVFQCTCPAVGPSRILEAVSAFLADTSLRTAASTVPLHDVCWDAKGRHYGDWVNRQHDEPALWRETGAIRLMRDPALLPSMVDLDGHHLIELTTAEALDIDDHPQLAAAKQLSVPVVFFAAVGPRVGSGHLHRVLTLADELAHHDIRIRLVPDAECPDPSEHEALVLAAGHQLMGDETTTPNPDRPSIVVLDVLDSDPHLVWMLREMGHQVVSLEDGGPGANLAHCAVNELLSEGEHAGPDYAVLRPEFLTGRAHAPTMTPADVRGRAKILLYFGGSEVGRDMASRATFTLGDLGDITNYTGANGTEPVPLSEAMATHHLLVTGQGRAVYAAAHVGIPTISVPLNGREAGHLQLPSVVYLPRQELLAPTQLSMTARSLLRVAAYRRELSILGQLLVDGAGTRRVAQLIDNLAGDLP